MEKCKYKCNGSPEFAPGKKLVWQPARTKLLCHIKGMDEVWRLGAQNMVTVKGREEELAREMKKYHLEIVRVHKTKLKGEE